jgi:hypothetical protein
MLQLQKFIKVNPLTPNAAFDQLTMCVFTFSARFVCLKHKEKRADK